VGVLAGSIQGVYRECHKRKDLQDRRFTPEHAHCSPGLLENYWREHGKKERKRSPSWICQSASCPGRSIPGEKVSIVPGEVVKHERKDLALFRLL